MKKTIVLLLVCIFVFLIYLGCQDNKIYYAAIGDRLSTASNYSYYLKNNFIGNLEYYSSEFLSNNNRSIDLLNDINDNKKINEKTIKNVLIKADIVTIAIGSNEIINKLAVNDDNMFVYIDEMIVDINNLFEELRKDCKENIFVLSYYNYFNVIKYDKYIEYANKRLNDLCSKYNFYYIDISVMNNYIDNTLYPNISGHKKIAEIINSVIVKNKLI